MTTRIADSVIEARPVIAAHTVDATKVYGRAETEVRALDGIAVDFAASRFTAIMGPSGSGKSTLLHCIAGLDTLTSGHAFIGDEDLSTLDDRQLTMLRRDRIGFVFQAYNLVPTLTALENVVLPLLLATGQLRRTMLQPVRQPHGVNHGTDPFLITLAAGQPQRQYHVLQCRERRNQVVGLEDEADPITPQHRQLPVIERAEVLIADECVA